MLVRRKLISYCNSKNNAISTFLSFCDIIFKFDEFAAFINEQHGDSVAVDIAITDIETIGDDVSKKMCCMENFRLKHPNQSTELTSGLLT